MTVHAATIALSAFLLFLLQPIAARQILPWFGGSAAVWTTCAVFFQLTLLAGYAYSDLLTRKLDARRQALVHAGLLVASLALLPIAIGEQFKPVDADNPIGRILLLLSATVGVPFLLLSTTGPLVQAWAARRRPDGNAYRLYALSNLGSMTALLAYPPLIEPLTTTRAQVTGWSVGYAAFVVFGVIAARLAARLPPVSAERPGDAYATQPRAPGIRDQALWAALSMLGSVLLLTVTAHITQNVASIPFLWIAPLTLYLLSFILCFDGRGWYWPRSYTVASAVAAVAMLAAMSLSIDPDTGWPVRGLPGISTAIPVYLTGLFVICMFCHGELARRRPPTSQLTRFYLMVALGGAAGGLLVGIAAPLLSPIDWELPVALACVTALALSLGTDRIRPVAAAAFCVALVGVGDRIKQSRHETLESDRNFYGTLQVRQSGSDDDPQARRTLQHGVINHGEQFVAPERAREPTAYYGPESGIGRSLLAHQAAFADRPMRVGVVGLGVGTLAAYGRRGDTYRFYEINPLVERIARQHFSYLADSPATVETAFGDARLVLEREPPHGFDVLAIDAFSSDAIPVHLLTLEAGRVYRRHVADDGVIAIHISNRYLDLSSVCLRIAQSLGWQALRIIDRPSGKPGLHPSDWVLITANAALLDRLRGGAADLRLPTAGAPRAWTDDDHSLYEVLK